MSRFLAVVVVSVLCVTAPPGMAQQMPPTPKPGPEYQLLKQDVGVWDAVVEMFMAPGAPPSVSKGTDTVTMIGAYWQVAQFKSEMMGQPFEGLGSTGFDPARQKYVGTWIDSMAPGIATSEASYDAATRTLTGIMDARNEKGVLVKIRETTEWKNADTRVFTMYGAKGADGKEPITMRITYQRRK